MNLRLNGLIAAPHTPMHSDGSLKIETVARQAAGLRAAGVAGAFVCGTTGEGVSMTSAERRAVAEAWVAAAHGESPRDGLKVIVNASHLCLADAQELAAHARTIGADAFAVMAPGFFKPAAVDDLAAYCAEVAAAAPTLPFYYYHMPGMTGVALPMAELLPRAAARIPNFAGIKFTSEDLFDFARCREIAAGSFDVLFGRDEILLGALALGATGAIGSTYNFAAPIYRRVIDCFKEGDLEAARCFQMKAIEMIAVLNRHGGLAAGKAVMALIGIDCGPVRLPLRALGPAELASLEAEITRLGVLETLRKVV